MQRFEIVNGVAEVEGVANEATADTAEAEGSYKEVGTDTLHFYCFSSLSSTFLL
jgi:hypothetical protein